MLIDPLAKREPETTCRWAVNLIIFIHRQLLRLHLSLDVLHINYIANTLHCRGGADSTREWDVHGVIDDTPAVFVQRKHPDGRVELQGEENEAQPEHSQVPHDDGNDEETSR